ncbi:MAG TPA: DUF2254 family protein [Vicinamibacteria bacterium]|nr:DUF2254 family protein [Vicinamibacteria bacterium]
MKGNVLTLARGVLAMAAILAAISGTTVLADALRAGLPLPRLASFDINEARNLINAFSRAGNQLVAVVFTTVSIAVPLTANMYSLKFLEFFLKDRVNAGMLLLAATVALNTIVVQYATKDDFVPMLALHAHFALLALAFALLFPYLYYLFRFLHPNTLLDRLRDECLHHLSLAARRRTRLAEHRRRVGESFEHIANIAVRSVDRLDRNTAIEAVHVLEDLAGRYQRVKPRLPPEWFQAEKELFLSFSSRAVDEANEGRSWVEMKLLSQLRQVFGSAVTRMHDVTSAVAKALRRFGLAEGVRSDPRLRELTVEYFNTFIRRTLNARDVRSVFTLVDQYRIFAEEIMADDPDLVLEIADYFAYYGQVARDLKIGFAVDTVAHDLGALVRESWEKGSPAAGPLLDAFLRYDGDGSAGVRKARAILGSYYLMKGHAAAAAKVGDRLRHLGAADLDRLGAELMAVRREKYWEVNERRMNVEYVPEPQRSLLREFLAGLGGDAGRRPL